MFVVFVEPGDVLYTVNLCSMNPMEVDDLFLTIDHRMMLGSPNLQDALGY